MPGIIDLVPTKEYGCYVQDPPQPRPVRGEIRQMRKTLWIIASLFATFISAPNASADTLYAPTFTCLYSCVVPVPTGTDVSFGPTWTPATFTLTITFDSEIFTVPLQDAAGPGIYADSPTDAYLWWIGSYYSSGNNQFILDDLDTGDWIVAGFFPASLSGEGGSLTFAAVPEPSPVVLVLLGIGFVLVVWKRVARDLPSAI